MTDFDKVVNTDSMPAVSFLKAPMYQDGHAGYSDPIDEQQFVVTRINAIQKSKNWDSTAVVLAYDDSDGWYDRAVPVLRLHRRIRTTRPRERCRDRPQRPGEPPVRHDGLRQGRE
ncbi:hypothetical protein CTI14_41340, partial [Methylobacterium radiotolerans]